MTDFSKATPRPWRHHENSHYVEIHGGNKIRIADTCASSCDGDIELGRANAALIVQAVNAFLPMLKALQFYHFECMVDHTDAYSQALFDDKGSRAMDAIDEAGGWAMVADLEAALAKAKGGAA